MISIGTPVEDIVTGFRGVVIDARFYKFIDEAAYEVKLAHPIEYTCVWRKKEQLKVIGPPTFYNKLLKEEKRQMINMNDQVEDTVTGFKGMVTGKCIYRNGCVQYLVMPRIDADGKMLHGEWIDVGQLKVIKEAEYKEEEAETGGPQKNTPGRSSNNRY